MNKYFRKSVSGEFAATCLLFSFLLLPAQPAGAALNSARITQVIRDVNLVPSSATPRPAAINDDVREGTAVRTGQDSRTELTFTDKTLMRLGANSIFSFNVGAGAFDLGQGSILMQVPPNGSSVKVKTAAVTAAITGGTAIFGTGPPTKFMVLEGTGTFYPAGHPEEAVTLHSGEMVTLTPDGHLVGPVAFDVKKVLETSELITSFPDLANLPLILAVIREQEALYAANPPPPPPPKDTTEVVDQEIAASPTPTPIPESTPTPTPTPEPTPTPTPTPEPTPTPTPEPTPTPTPEPTPTPTPSGTPGKYGTPIVISSPVPYVITSGTAITTDPSITTNGQTDYGKIYRGQAQDGLLSDYLFGSTTSFDTMVMDFSNGNGNGLPVAVFKFSQLQLAGDPTISVLNGGATNLGFVSVGDMTSAAPGGTLTFSGVDRVFFATQNGSIILGSDIAFSGISHLDFYARGTGSNLTLASPISGGDVVHLYSEGTVQVNGDITAASEFRSFSGGDFLAGSGVITATNVDVESLSNINIDGSKFPNPPDNTGSFVLNATNTLNLTNVWSSPPFGWDSLTATANTINITSSTPTAFDFSNSSSVTFTAGTGGIQAPNIDFVGSPPGGLNLTSGSSINIGSIHSEDATISAATSFTASGDVEGGAFIGTTLTAGTTVDVGGNLYVYPTLTAGGNINVGNNFIALNVNAPSSILTVHGNIGPFGGPGSLQYTFNVDSIVSPAGINFSFNGTPNFVGKLTINANTLTFDPATGIAFANFNGVNADEFGSGNPAEGGDGGTFIVNTTGNITANNGADITATTGLNSAAGVYSGAGGSVTLLSTGGMVTVNDTIQVSSDDSEAPRQSASGGTILLQSDLTTGQGITVGSNGSLLSLLNSNAPGPGGSITLSTMGADIVVNGTIEADRGTITMDQNDPAGSTPTITIDGATIIAQTLNITSPGEVDIGLNNAVTLSVGAMAVSVDNSNGNLTTGGNITLNLAGDLALSSGDLALTILNPNGHIGTGGNITLTIPGNLTAGSATIQILNTTGSIGGDATASLDVNGSATVSGVLQMLIENYDFSGNTPGQIGGGANISIATGGDLSAGSLIGLINNRSGGSIGSAANLTINVGGALTTSTDITDPFGFPESLSLTISSRFDNLNGNPAGASSINGDATLSVSADSASIGGELSAIISNSGSTLNGNALLEFGITNNMTVQNEADIEILNDADIASPSGGTIHGSATLQVSANDFTANALFAQIDNRRGGGVIDSDATIAFNLTGNFSIPGTNPGNPDFDSTVPGEADLLIQNQRGTGTAGGMIGGNASITLSANNISTAGLLDPNIINNFGTIMGNATIGITSTGNVTADSLDVEIDNFGGSIGGNETINMNVGGTATTTGDATFAITGNDPTGAAAINFNGGSYQVGGTFLSTIDGNGTITFSNAAIQADIVKVGVFGANGTLMVGGGHISGDTLLRLYAPGSNGMIEFVANVTLSNQSSAVIIAAKIVTIFNGVVVTIGGPTSASVFTDVPNYTGSGGNGSTTGIFAGTGATTQPLANAPDFNSPPPSGTPSEFGPPSVISSPVPYVITSGTTITTDPTITTNGQTNYGTIYRDQSQDGPFTTWAFGSTSTFDTASGFDAGIQHSGAVFKFTSLQLTGNPTVSTINGGETNLALIGVNGVTSGGPGGTLTFTGIDGLLIATENGSINLGSEISFSGSHDLNFYARGSGSSLTLGSAISGITNLRLFSEGTIQINGAISTTNFNVFSGGDFLTPTATITATNIDIHSLSNITLDAQLIPDAGGGPINLNAANTLTINNMGGGTFGRDSLTAQATTINLQPTESFATFDFSQSSSVTLTAGTGGINASGIDFYGHNLTLESGGDIDIYSARTPSDINENQILDGTINAAGNITSVGDVDTGTIHSGGSTTVGGRLLAGDISADADVSGAQGITAVGGSIVAGGNITSQNGTIELQQNPPGTFGNITAGGNIFAGGGIFTPGDPVVVMAGGSITAPGVITGTLQAGTDITIDNTPGDFGFGIIANHIIAGGTLFMMNSPTISPNNGGSGGNDGETFDDFTMTVGSIVSTGPTYPILSSNGGDANSNFDDSNPGNGGHITLTTTIGGLTIGDAQDLDSISANGGAYNASGPFGGGNGGKIDIVSAGDVVINAPNSGGPAISATTGIVPDIFSYYAGNGGTVNITSTGGAITVNGTVQVSNDDAGQLVFRPLEGNVPGRESASGGTIDLQSNLTAGTGITVGANGALLSYLSLDAVNADGAPGSITLSTMGADIVVNGTVRADFGTVTIDQDDPAADVTIPTITLDGGTVQTATFNINGSGDLTIGPNNATAINIFGGTWNVAHDITINAANTSFAYSFALNATAGNAINFTGGNSDVSATLTFPLSGDTTLTAGAGGINAHFVDIQYAGAALNLVSAGDITANSITFTDSFARGNVNAAGAISITGNLWEGDITAGTSLNVGGGIIGNAITAGTTITAGQYISATSLTTGGDITAGNTSVQYITSPTGVLRVANGIKPSIFSTAPGFPQGAAAPHIYTVDSIVSPNGIDFSGNQFDGIAGLSSGGLLTINANSLSFDPSTGIGPVNFNGADQNGFSNGTTPTLPGDGGNLTVNTTGTIVVNSDIEATSGYFQPVPSATPAGFGGTVDLNSSGDTVTVNNRIEVSSAEPASTIAPFRQSAKGGNINLTSGKTSGVAISVNNSAQLLSLLSAAAPGPGGKITILASASNNSGNSSSINIDNSNGLIEADGSGGTVDIEHNGDSGTININNANIRADVVKVGAFGDNGTLNIGGGVINADTMLKLYATGSNGSVNFIADVTLSGASTKIIAGNSVTIFNSVVVTVGGPAATVYTSHPNYTGSGGNNSTTGIFSGSGATTVPSGTPPPF